MLDAARIKRQALALGFDLCGIAATESYPELRFLEEWLNRGYAADMEWLRRSADRRSDVRAVLPDAQSVIVTATVYNTDEAHADPPPDVARIARYARGDDYHGVLQNRLETLLAWMREESPTPFEARAYVDTGPVQERVYAQYAGLGWIGKNTCLINAELGSLLFLAEIICTLRLEPDTQALEQCGSCTRCLDACPTGALVDTGVLDANRCISYLTIERRGSIPEELRVPLGNQVYGCDICQTVCPYNEVPPRSADRSWHTRRGLELPKLVDLWCRTDAELKALTRGSAMTRAKLSGLRRNMAVAMGNSGDPDAVAALAVPFPDRESADDPMVQEHVAWALSRTRKLP